MKVVVIGEGFGARAMAPVYGQLGFETEVVSSRDGEAVKRACSRAVDLVSIHSPPFLHHEHVMCALDHGRAILCDKPFGRGAVEAREMRDRARHRGVLNFLNFEFRWEPSRVRVKELVSGGAIGTPSHFSWMGITNRFRDQEHRWLFDAGLAGGWLGANGSHMIDALRWLFGSEVADCGGVWRTEVPMRVDRHGRSQPSTAEDAFTAWFLMENGCTAAFGTACSASVATPERLVLMGNEGSLELLSNDTLIVRRPSEEDRTFTIVRQPALVPWLCEVRDSLRDGRQIAPSFDDGLAVAQAMDLLRAKWIRAGGDR